MKKLLLILVIVISYTYTEAQVSYQKGNCIGFGGFTVDFQTASELRTRGINYVVQHHNYFDISRQNIGVSFNYMKGLTNLLDLQTTFGVTTLDYPNENIKPTADENLYMEAASMVNIKLLSDKYFLTPFVNVGAGASKYRSYFAAFVPVGLGLQLSVERDFYLLVQSQYRVPVTANASYHFYHSIGFSTQIWRKEAPAPKAVEIPVVSDRDGDGVVDSLDACPDTPGLASLQGCPDRDKDGIADKDDKCPDVPGIAKYQGCPIPDTDGDGINDEEDKCPTVPGVARYNGCPVPDTDGDGVNDEEDKCPKEPGPASNFGCPVIEKKTVERVEKAAKNLFFATGSAKLLKKSDPALSELIKVLKDNPDYKVDIEGHTDITGTRERNMTLSNERAGAVKTYLVSNGIEEGRITITGYGPDKPIADNKTAAGRAKNRRVEIKLRNY